VRASSSQRRTIHIALAILVAACALLFTPDLRAQYTTNFQDTIISGITSNWTGDYIVGSNTFADILFILNGGMLANSNGYVGYETSGSENIAVVIGSGSVWSNSGDLNVGYHGSANTLIISGGATVVDGSGRAGGLFQDSFDNAITVTDPGTVWSNRNDVAIGYGPCCGEHENFGNSLVISNGATVCSTGGSVHGQSRGVVTGSGTVWWNSGGLSIAEYDGQNVAFTISDGAAVYNTDGFLDETALVTGNGSVWSNSGNLFVRGSDLIAEYGSLIISNGASVFSASGDVVGNRILLALLVTGSGSVWRIENDLNLSGYYGIMGISDGGALYCGSFSCNGYGSVQVVGAGSVWDVGGAIASEVDYSSISISGGAVVVAGGVTSGRLSVGVGEGSSLYVTNGTGIIYLHGPFGGLSIGGGTVMANELIVLPNGQSPAGFGFGSGLFVSGSTYFTNGHSFVVGDGTSMATFHLAGGFHSFANGLEINTNSFLTGCGTIDGSVVVDSNATVIADCGGSLTFTSIVTNNGTMQAINGSVLEAYGTVVNDGVIDITGGTTNFHGAFINNGIVITTNNLPVITATWLVGTDVEIGVKTGNGDTYVFEETTNLTGAAWTPVIEFTGTGGVITFIDPGAAGLPQRFYRVGLVPTPSP
jgi:fibronectin-binding autotransporter adhesin